VDDVEPLGESGGDHADSLGVVRAPLDHLLVVDRRELRVQATGGVGGGGQLVAQTGGASLASGWPFRSVCPVWFARGARPVKD